MKTTQKELNSFIHGNTDLSILRLEEFLEDLEDRDLLNEKGIALRNTLWETYIKQDDKLPVKK